MQIALRREKCNFDGLLQDKLGSAETAMDVHNCGYGRTTGTGMVMLRIRIRAYGHRH